MPPGSTVLQKPVQKTDDFQPTFLNQMTRAVLIQHFPFLRVSILD